MTHYEAYFNHQYGGSGRGVNNIFVGSRGQRGHGVGSFLAGLFRRALPFITKGARAIGKEAVRASVNVIDDITENNMSFTDSLQNRASESGKNLTRKATNKLRNMMEGSGYKSLTRNRITQLRRGSGTRKKSSSTKNKKLKRLVNKKRKKRISKKGKKKNLKKKKTNKTKRKTKKQKITDIFE